MADEKFKWDQEYDSIEIVVPLKNVVAKDDVKIKLTRKTFDLKVKDEEVLNGVLCDFVRCDDKDVMFYIDGESLIITLEKENKKWWDSLFVDGDKIDVNELAEKKQTRFDDLDPEARSLVEKMMYEQKVKNSGGSTEQELKAAEIMEKLKNQNINLDSEEKKESS